MKLIDKYQALIIKRLSKKTGWGRNELHQILQDAKEELMRGLIDEQNN